MAWFALARVLFVAAVAYVAALLHPLRVSAPHAVERDRPGLVQAQSI